MSLREQVAERRAALRQRLRGRYHSEADDTPATQDLSVSQRNALLEALSNQTWTAASNLGWALGRPAAYLQGALVGRPGDALKSGEFLRELGIRPEKDTLGGWARPVADFATDVVVDPLNLLTFGGSALTKGGKVLKAAGLADDAARVASRRLVDDVLRSQGKTAFQGRHVTNATRAWRRHFEPGLADDAARAAAISDRDLASRLTDLHLAQRPLVGRRAAQKSLTVDDIVRAQADPTAARSAVMNAASRQGVSDYAQIAGQRIGADVSAGLGRFHLGSFNTGPLGAASDAMFDRLGQAARWSTPGRYAHSLFNTATQGGVKESDQIAGMMDWHGAVLPGQQAARALTGSLTRRMAEASPSFFQDPSLSTAFRSTVENVATPAQLQAVQDANLTPFVGEVRNLLESYIGKSRDAGIGSGRLADKYGTGYFPRAFDQDIYPRGSAPVTGGKKFSVNTGDQIARSSAYSIPGGTEAVNRLSRDARVTGATTDNEAASYILDQVHRSGGADYTRPQAVKLARDIRGMTPEAVKGGRAIFDNHAMEDLGRYIQGREIAIRRAKGLTSELASNARVGQNYLDVAAGYGRHGDMARTMRGLGLRSSKMHGPLMSGETRPFVQGARVNLADELNQRLASAGSGMRVSAEDLSDVAINSEVIGRLNRIADYYANPESQSKILRVLDGITANWKSSVLAWGSRIFRDFYSGAISNVIEVGANKSLVRGYSLTRYVHQGQFDKAAPLIMAMPRYAGMTAQDAVARYRDEIAEFGLLSGRRMEDYGTQLTGKQTGEGILSELVPGAHPVTTVGYQAANLFDGGLQPFNRMAMSELGNVQAYRDSITDAAAAVNPFNERSFVDWVTDKNVRDPILRWSGRLADTTDQINRLAGYNALLLQGVSPEEAARRIASSQINYGNLTKFERGFVRRIIPFWTYNSRIGKYVLEKIAEKPGGAYTKAVLQLPDRIASAGQEEGEYVPEEVKKSIGFSLEPMRDMPLIGPMVNAIAPQAPGVESYLANFDAPGVGTINNIKIRRNLDGTPQILNSITDTALGTIGGLAHPMIRSTVEALSGRNLYTGKPMSEYTPTLQKLARASGLVSPLSQADEATKYAAYLTDYIPHMPRVMQTLNRLMDSERVPDPRARALQAFLNSQSGTMVKNVSTDAAALDASRQLQQMMSDSPALRTFSSKYIPEELLPYASPEDLLLYRLDREMKRAARKAKLQRDGGYHPYFN